VASGGSGPTTNLRKIKAGTGATVSVVGSDIVIDATGAGGGEINDLVQVGIGAFIRKQKSGASIEVKSLKSNGTVTVNDNVDDIEFIVDHVNIQSIGTNTHAQIDTHIDSSPTIHFTEGSIDHLNIQNIGTNSHAAIDTHIADGTLHFTEASIDHANILNIGTNSHGTIDTHIADATVHYTQAAIDHNAILNSGTNTHADIDAHIIATSNPHGVTAAQAGAVDLTGDTMTGPLVLSGAPAVDLGAATKLYVESATGVGPHGTTHENNGPDEIDVTGLDGVLNQSQSVTVEDEGISQGQAQILNITGTGASASISLGRATINVTDPEKLSLSGGTMTGNLILNADPTVNLGASTKQYVDAHSSDTGNPHSTSIANIGSGSLGQLNTAVTDATLIDTTDPRLSDARTPTSHGSTHANNGSDEVDVTDLSGRLADNQFSGIQDSGTPDVSAHTLNFDTNLTVTVAAGVATIDASGGIPGAHASTHEFGGGDVINVDQLSGRLLGSQFVEVQDEGAGGANAHTINFAGAGVSSSVATDVATVTISGVPVAHASSHQNNQSDEIDVTGLSGLLDDAQTPLAHSTTHENGQADEISVAGLSGELADPQPVTIQDSGAGQGPATTLNFGAGLSATVAGSTASVINRRSTVVEIFDASDAITEGVGKRNFTVPANLAGTNLVAVSAAVGDSESSSGVIDIQIVRLRAAGAGPPRVAANMLSTTLTIDANELHSKDATTAAVIDTANDDVADGDVLRFDIEPGGAGTGAQGLQVTLEFE
jgi:hypothetical protein